MCKNKTEVTEVLKSNICAFVAQNSPDAYKAKRWVQLKTVVLRREFSGSPAAATNGGL